MNNSAAGMYVTGNTTIQSALASAAAIPYITGWTSDTAGVHSDGTFTIDASTGKITAVPGVYEFVFEGSVEVPETSGALTSGDGAGEIAWQFYRGGSAVTGAKSLHQIDTAGTPVQVSLSKIIEITEAQHEASTAYVQVYPVASDASGNDILLKEGRFYAKRLS